MPFTPFHMGAAMAAKPVFQARFSLVAFGLAQIAMDVEPLARMYAHSEVVHGPTHSFPGAVLIALFVILLAPFVCRLLISFFNRLAGIFQLEWLMEPERPSNRVLLWSALYGTLSHLLLDAAMHADMKPFYPFSDKNPFLGLLGHEAIYQWCFFLILLGTLAWIAVKWLRRPRRS